MGVPVDFWDRFINKIRDPHMVKQAEYAMDSVIRDRMLENGIVRNNGILPTIKISNQQLDKDEDPKKLKKFVELDAYAKATYVPFRGMPDAEIVEARFLACYFDKIETDVYTSNYNELRTSTIDLNKMLEEQFAKALQDVEDTAFINRLNQLVALNPAEQDLVFFGGLTKETWTAALQSYYINKPLNCMLMNKRTSKEFLKWDYQADIPVGLLTADMYSKQETPKMGGRIVETIKDYLIPDGVVWFLPEPDFMGKFFELESPKTFIESRKDWFSMSASEIVGLVIANTRSFIKCTFKN
jgi:hypothetical protein